VFVDWGRKNISCARAQGTLGTPLRIKAVITYENSKRDQWRSKGTLRPEAKYIFMLPSTKTAEFEVKIGSKAWK